MSTDVNENDELVDGAEEGAEEESRRGERQPP